MGRISQTDKEKLAVLNKNYEKYGAYSKTDDDLIKKLDNMKLLSYEDEKKMMPIMNLYKEKMRKEMFLCFEQYKNSFKLYNDIDQSNIGSFDLNKMFYSFPNKPFKCQLNEIIPKTFFTNSLLNTNDESILMFLPLLRDKCYQLYNQLIKPFEPVFERVQYIIKNKMRLFRNDNISREDLLSSMFNSLNEFIKSYLNYTNQLPGFNNIGMEDLNIIHKEYSMIIFFLNTNKFYIDDECYFVFDNKIQFSRKLITDTVGLKACEYVFDFQKKFKSLNLTTYEICLLFPFLLTSIGKFY